VEIESRVVEGANIHREILEQAESLRADLIVIGSHGRSGFERLLLGSITEKVLRKARCPVVVVPRRSEGVPSGQRAFTRILCPMDFSCSAVAAYKRAVALARKTGATLTVLHVVDVPAVLHDMPGFDIATYREEAETKGRARLADLVSDSAGHGPNVMVIEGRAGTEILRVAAERDADLIVMGVQGRTAIDLMVFGSTTHEVIRNAPCPVLTIRREEAV
jgi:nucleotide-binding universal stress UspA family protein